MSSKMLQMKLISITCLTILIGSISAPAQGDLQVTKKPLSGIYTDVQYPENVLEIIPKQSEASPRALREWSNERFGLFIHWGAYSVLGGKWRGEKIPKLGEQIQRHAQISGEDYLQEVVKKFNPIKFDARKYARMAKSAGMRYIILTSKHHDGFCMFDSKYTDYDIMDSSPYKKDIVKAFADACREEGLKFGVYYSNPDWHHNEHSLKDTKFSVNERFEEEYITFEKNQLSELLTNYGPMFEIFFDMGKPTIEQSAELAKLVHRLQPNCLVSGRVMNNQGDFFTMSDNREPSAPIETPWEVPCTFKAVGSKHTWGYKSWVKHPPVSEELKTRVTQLSRVSSRGGNYLLNIGPRPDGTIQPYHREVLTKMGKWVNRNREAIFGTRSTPFVKMDWGEATWREGKLYLHITSWPSNGSLEIEGLKSKVTEVHPLADPNASYEFNQNAASLTIETPKQAPDKILPILAVEYSGNMETVAPKVVQSNPDRIELGQGDEINRNFYYGKSYHNSCSRARVWWDFAVSNPGEYKLAIIYKARSNKNKQEPQVVFSVENSEFHLTLPASREWTTLELGSLDLDKSSRTRILMTADAEALLKENPSADQRILSTRGVEIKKILFKRK